MSESLFQEIRDAEMWSRELCDVLIDIAEQAYRAVLVWHGDGDPDADFLCIEKHLARLGVTP